MKVTFKGRNIYFSRALANESNLRKGSKVFLFSVKGTKTFGFHKSDSDMENGGILVYPVRTTPSGKLYITPIAPPVDLICATMRLSYKTRRTIGVSKKTIKDLPIFIFQE